MDNQAELKFKWWEYIITLPIFIILYVGFWWMLIKIVIGFWNVLTGSNLPSCDPNYEDCGPAGTYPAYEYGD